MSVPRGGCVLVLEDEFLIAVDLVQMLEDIGMRVVGPAASIEAAQALLATQDVDVAILDLNINGRRSDPVAALLAARGIPYILATGYDDAGAAAGAAAVVRKPYGQAVIASALSAALG